VVARDAATKGLRKMTNLVPFNFDGHQVRTVMIDGAPWFVVSDVCDVLDIQNAPEAAKNLGKDDIAKIYIVSADGKRRNVWTTNEPGLYQLIFRSNKPEAKQFQHWIYKDVLPSIRKTGKFQVDVPFLVPIAQPWTKTFDADFYSNIFRLKGKTPVAFKEAPWLAQVTNDLVYRRLPEGVFDALQLINPVLPGRKHRAKKQHQFVESTVARRHLDRLLDRCTGMMTAFGNWNEFYGAWNRIYPIERDLPGELAFNFADSQTLLFPFMLEALTPH
jgi:prophage antirepressor-like protein